LAKSFDIQGYNFTGYGTDVFGTGTSANELKLLANSGVNSVAIVPNYYMDTINSSSVFADEITPTDADVIAGIKAAQAAGLDVLLKPHVDPLDGIWRAYLDPADPAAWFASYKAMLVNYAQIAQQTGLKTMSIGTELASMTGANYRAEWLDIIDAVRGVFDGELTYSAEWGEAKTLSFWDELDVIGIDGYFPLSVDDKTPTVAELKFSWMHPSANDYIQDLLGGLSPVEYLRDLSEQYGKKVMFTEIGYRPIEGAATSPGDWEMNGAFNEKAQTNLYKALFDVFGSQGGDWFSGFYIWDRRAENREGLKDYHTEGRAAQKIIDRWYGMDDDDSAAPNTGMTLYGSVRDDALVGGIGGTRILGGDGNDTLTGGDGKDTLVGGRSEGAAGGTSIISLAAYSDLLDGEGARFEVLVNGDVVGKGEAGAGGKENWDFDRFSFSFDTPAQFQSVKIVFTNDDSSGNKDRNLYVTEIAVNGETIDLAEADNDQEPNTGALYANGSFTLDLTPYEAQLTPSEADNDTLAGGLGADRLSGGVGKDIFLFVSVDEVFGDVITDFVSGDDIVNLDAIDADEDAVGGQDFTWRGDQGLSGAAGDLAYRFKRDMTLVSGDTDGDGVADFTLRLTGKLTLQATDFDL
jgi:Ca2+-binding RTX toxin-like protein